MKTYWISDPEGRRLGPIGLEVLGELIVSGRVQEGTQVSTDGQKWAPLGGYPEVTWFVEQRNPSFRHARERADARKLRAQLEGLRVRPPHEIFKVAPDAPVEVWREAFFKLSKRFHPEVLPPDVDPELAEACAVAFRFLSGLMTRVEMGAHRPPEPPRQARVPPPPPPPPAPEPPRYDPEDFVGLKALSPGVAQARIRVTARNVGMFTDHPLMNLAKGSFFLADPRVLPLGTTVALTFTFDDPEYTVVGKGRVAWEDAGKSNSPRGFGITFLDLRPADRDFIRAYIDRARAPRAAAQG